MISQFSCSRNKESNYIPYMITIFGTLKTESNDLEKQKEELFTTNRQYLISHADDIFLEANESKIANIH